MDEFEHTPTAARWLVPASSAAEVVRAPTGAAAVAVDVVGELLALDPRTRLQGRGGAALRALATVAEALVTASAATVSGVALVDVLVADPALRQSLAPSWDLAALLDDRVGRPSPVDRTIRLAEAMTDRARQHRDGEVDLGGMVAPPGLTRHASAEEIEALVRAAVDPVRLAVVAEPAVAVHRQGWIAASTLELFLLAGSGAVQGRAAEVVGSVLASWLQTLTPADPWLGALPPGTTIEVEELLDQAASRAGSDHPDVIGPIVVESIRMRHPHG